MIRTIAIIVLVGCIIGIILIMLDGLGFVDETQRVRISKKNSTTT